MLPIFISNWSRSNSIQPISNSTEAQSIVSPKDHPIKKKKKSNTSQFHLDLSSLSLVEFQKRSPIYILSVSYDRIAFFAPSRMNFIVESRDQIPSVKEGELYHLSSLHRMDSLTTLTLIHLNQYTRRNNFICSSLSSYRQFVLPSLLLGCRVRDFEQRLATVIQMGELKLRMKNQRGKMMERLRLRTFDGDSFTVDVKGLEKGDRHCMITCRSPDSLPSSVHLGCLLEIVEDEAIQPHTTNVLSATHARKKSPIDNWELLQCIYGTPSHKSLPTIKSFTTRIRLVDGDSLKLNLEQSQAVSLYSSSIRSFIIESPLDRERSGKTFTAAAMAMNYRGRGVQLFLSTSNLPVVNMALALAKMDLGEKKALHFISSERCEEEQRSPFSILSLTKKQKGMNEKITRLEEELFATKDEEERKRLREAMRRVSYPVISSRYSIYLATVDTIIGRLMKQNKGGSHRIDPIKDQLMNEVEKVVIDEGSQLTESSLNAIILSFPRAQIVLIGDSKQLPPFRFEKGEIVSEMSGRSAIEVMKEKGNLPLNRLNRVYRASPSLINHYSRVFYEGVLISCREESTTNPLSCLESDGPCLFWRVKNGQSKTEGTSKVNEEEIDALVYIVNRLRREGFDENEVMIISLYEAQRKIAKERLKKGYEVITVDSAQVCIYSFV